METLGIAQESRARARRYAALNPAQASRILGERPKYAVAMAGARIEVNIATGERTVSRITVQQSDADIIAAFHSALVSRIRREEVVREKRTRHSLDCQADAADIMNAVTRASSISASAIGGRDNSQYIVRARHLYWYILAALRPDIGFPSLARSIPGRVWDHTTVMSAIAKFARKLVDDREMKKMVLHPAVAPLFEKAYANPRIVGGAK